MAPRLHILSILITLQTQRLLLRPMTLGDAAFAVEILNDPGFIRFIGDRQVRDETQARAWLERGNLTAYRESATGMLAVTQLAMPERCIGICGLVLRPELAPDYDLGYAFLPQFGGQGFALEAAQAVTRYAQYERNLPRLLGIVDPDNTRSVKLLESLGMRCVRSQRMENETDDISVYEIPFLDRA